MKPGVYPNIPFKDYLAINAVSNSYLGRLNDCPAKALVPREDTLSLLLGRAVHKAVLEGMDAFNAEFAIGPDVDKRTKAGKEEWAAFETSADARGKIILKKDDLDKVLLMANAVFRHPWASKLLAEGVSEQTILWQDFDSGLMCKARPDRLPDEGKRTLVDLKTTRDAGEKAFMRSITEYGYARQAAFYLDGMNYLKKGTLKNTFFDLFVFVAVETEEPYRVEVYTLSNDFIEYGRQEYRRLLQVEQDCRKAGAYPHYSNEGIVELYKPGWLI